MEAEKAGLLGEPEGEAQPGLSQNTPEPLHAYKPSCSSVCPSARLAVSRRVICQIHPPVASLFYLCLFKPLSLLCLLPLLSTPYFLWFRVFFGLRLGTGLCQAAQGQAWCWVGSGRVLGTPGPHQQGQLHFASWLDAFWPQGREWSQALPCCKALCGRAP